MLRLKCMSQWCKWVTYTSAVAPSQDVSFQKICKGQAAPRAREKDGVSMVMVRMLFICSESACSAMWDWPKSRRCSGVDHDDGDEQKHKTLHVRPSSVLCRVARFTFKHHLWDSLWFGLPVSLSLCLLYTAVHRQPLHLFHNTKQAFTHEQESLTFDRPSKRLSSQRVKEEFKDLCCHDRQLRE